MKNELEAKVQKYSSDFHVPLCITRHVACKFGKRVYGPDRSEGAHFWWYNTLDVMGKDFVEQACWKQAGDMSGSVSVDSSSHISQTGACTSKYLKGASKTETQ